MHARVSENFHNVDINEHLVLAVWYWLILACVALVEISYLFGTLIQTIPVFVYCKCCDANVNGCLSRCRECWEISKPRGTHSVAHQQYVNISKTHARWTVSKLKEVKEVKICRKSVL